MERFLEDAREILGALDQVGVLGEGLAGAGDVGLLKDVAAEQLRIDLPRNGHERDAVHVGCGDAGNEIRRAGAGGGDAHAGLSGGTGVAAGGMSRILLLADENMADLRLIEEIIERADCRARISEGKLYAFKLQTFHHHFRAAYHEAPSFPYDLTRSPTGRGMEKPSRTPLIIKAIAASVKTLSR